MYFSAKAPPDFISSPYTEAGPRGYEKDSKKTKIIDKKEQSGFLVGAGLLSLANDAEEGRDQHFRRWRSATSRGLFPKKATLFTWAETINTLRRWDVPRGFAGRGGFWGRKNFDINGIVYFLSNYSTRLTNYSHHVFPFVPRLPSGRKIP